MGKWNWAVKRSAAFCAAAAVFLTAAAFYRGEIASHTIEQITAIESMRGGRTLLISEKRRSTLFEVLKADGTIEKRCERRRSRGEVSAVADAAVDESGLVYTIEDLCDPVSGEWKGQEIAVYDFNRMIGKTRARILLDSADGVRYRWIEAPGPLVLIGTGTGAASLTRTALDADILRERREVRVKSRKEFPLMAGEGVYQALSVGGRMAFVSRSGKVFVSDAAGEIQERYPARVLDRLMYAMFLAPNTEDTVLIGEQDSGDFVALNLLDGTANVLRRGSDAFPGTDYNSASVLSLSLRDAQNYTAVVKNGKTDRYELIVCRDGVFTQLDRAILSPVSCAAALILRAGASFLLLCAAAGLAAAAVRTVRRSRTILAKLMASAAPLTAAAVAAFGVFSCASYWNSLLESGRRQAGEEGTLLKTLLSAQDLNRVEFPYDYGSDAYLRIMAGLGRQPGEHRAAYYENGALWTGAGDEDPCFYPLDILKNSGMTRLYREAALSGEERAGVVATARGERVVYITPMGGLSGGAVYLIETGIYTAHLEDRYWAYVRGYVLFSSVFLAGMLLLMLVTFMRILRPVGSIKAGLESFARGDRSVRLSCAARGELSDICRVFNKMADDIDAQIYTLRTMSETYYRFIPQRIFQLLGKDNLDDLELGSHIRGRFAILSADLIHTRLTWDTEKERERINLFFQTVHCAVAAHRATVLADRVSLRGLKIICPDCDTAVRIALDAIAKIEGCHAPGQTARDQDMEASFLAHYTEAFFGICGDADRYIPSILSGEMEETANIYARFGALPNRLIVTSQAYEAMDASRYFSRFIGYADDARHDLGLYEFYDSASPRLTQMLNDTRSAFEKAMQLYQDRRYYDAKNLFAAVLRENQWDEVARNYIFRCEERLTPAQDR